MSSIPSYGMSTRLRDHGQPPTPGPCTDRHDRLLRLNRRLTECRLCPRLVSHREEAGVTKRRGFQDWQYWSRPVPGFGDPDAEVVVIGLAPAAHGGNRTGRMFTGDATARFLMEALYEVGFANQPFSEQLDDGLELNNLYLTAAGRCAPPADKPTREELHACSRYLEEELEILTRARVVLALGRVAFDSFLRLASGEHGRPLRLKFGHGVRHELPGDMPVLHASYHPSPRNHQTGRLNRGSLIEVLRTVKRDLPG